jgi:hypothetical protein
MSSQRFRRNPFSLTKRASAPPFDTSVTLTYNIWLRSLQPSQPGIDPSARAYNHYERSMNFSGSITQTQGLQRAAQSSAQPRRSEALASRCLPPMSRDAIASPGLPLVRHLSWRQGDRGQGREEESQIETFSRKRSPSRWLLRDFANKPLPWPNFGPLVRRFPNLRERK